MAWESSVKIINSNHQPQGGGGIVGISGARGLAAADKLDAQHVVSPFPPILASGIDMSIDVINEHMSGRYSIVQAYQPNSPSGVAVSP